MSDVQLTVEGIAEIRKALRDFEGGTSDLKAVHAEAARTVEEAVQPPRRTGRLAASVRSTGQARVGVIRAGRASVPYAGPIHYGWRRRNISPQPFLEDAGKRRTPAVAEVYDRGLEQLAARYGLT